MGYRLVKTEQLFAIWTHLKAGASNREIARDLGFDRKTVNAYAEKILGLCILPTATYSEALAFLSRLTSNGDGIKAGRISSENERLVRYLCSNKYYGYVVPCRVSAVNLAIDLPNRLLEIAEQEGLGAAPCRRGLRAGNCWKV
jgi:hypothetical protein